MLNATRNAFFEYCRLKTRDKLLKVSHNAGGSPLIHDVVVHMYHFGCYANLIVNMGAYS